MALLFVDLDRFKPINDSLGFEAAALSRHADAGMYRAKDAGRLGAPGR